MSVDSDSKPISEDDCVICGKWPARDRRALRKMIRALPVNEGPICKECLGSFWHGLVEPAEPEPPSKHSPRGRHLRCGGYSKSQ
jgi:hypothetical protein